MLDQQDVEHVAPDEAHGALLYRRPMPGGGYVEVELDASAAETASSERRGPLRGRIVMERRADPGRRFGHAAPVVAELSSDDHDELIADLFRLARDNAALARNLMRMGSGRRRCD